MPIKRLLAAFLFASLSEAHAFFFILPIPNIAKPPQLQSLIDALEKSSDTKAVAYVSEDKLFARKVWVWGQFAGVASQEEANARALKTCETNLAKAKAQSAGGQPLYAFGDKRCELHEFANKTVNLPVPTASSPQGTGTASGSSTPPAETRNDSVGSPAPAPINSSSPTAASGSGAPAGTIPATPQLSTPAATSNTAGAPSSAQPNTLETRLRQLQSLFEQNLISKDEYEKKRRQILESL